MDIPEKYRQAIVSTDDESVTLDVTKIPVHLRPKAALPRRRLAGRASTQGASSNVPLPPAVPPPPPSQPAATVPLPPSQPPPPPAQQGPSPGLEVANLKMENDALRKQLAEMEELANALKTKQQEYDSLLAAKTKLEQEVAQLRSAGQTLDDEKAELEEQLRASELRVTVMEMKEEVDAQKLNGLTAQLASLHADLDNLELVAAQEIDLLRPERSALEAAQPVPTQPDLVVAPAPLAVVPSEPVSSPAGPDTAWISLFFFFLLLLALLAVFAAFRWVGRPGAFGYGGPAADLALTRFAALVFVVCGQYFGV